MAGVISYQRDLNYLSSSSLYLYETDPALFYLRYLGPEETKPPRIEALYFDVGRAFDYLVKQSAMPHIGARHSAETPPEGEGLEIATAMWQAYVKSGAYTSWLDLGPIDLDFNPGIVDVDGVPVYGELDSVLRGPIVHDWKTTGSTSKTLVSPKAGWSHLFDSRDKPTKTQDPKPLEKVHKQWATQATIYDALLGHGPRAVPVCWDYVCPAPLPDVRVARYLTHVSEAYVWQVRRRLRDCWEAVQERNVVDPRLLGMGKPFVEVAHES